MIKMKLGLKDNKIFGMLHLAPSNNPDESTVAKAVAECKIYIEQGIYGVIVENYHGDIGQVLLTLRGIKTLNLDKKIKVGINILPNDFRMAYKIASEWGLDFIQLDFAAGKYERTDEIDFDELMMLKSLNKDIFLMGGVHPKYYTPVKGSVLSEDIKDAVIVCDAIVVTGEATGKETPLDKIKCFKLICDTLKKPLIIGAGLNSENVQQQLQYASGGIIGSAFKLNGDTRQTVRQDLVKEFMNKIK